MHWQAIFVFFGHLKHSFLSRQAWLSMLPMQMGSIETSELSSSKTKKKWENFSLNNVGQKRSGRIRLKSLCARDGDFAIFEGVGGACLEIDDGDFWEREEDSVIVVDGGFIGLIFFLDRTTKIMHFVEGGFGIDEDETHRLRPRGRRLW